LSLLRSLAARRLNTIGISRALVLSVHRDLAKLRLLAILRLERAIEAVGREGRLARWW